MYRVKIVMVLLLYAWNSSSFSQNFTDVRIFYPDDTVLVNLSDKEVKRIERKTRSYIGEFACEQIQFDDSKSYSLDSAQFISAINKIPNNLLSDMAMFCGMNFSRKGIHVKADAGFGEVSINNRSLLSAALGSDAQNWVLSPSNGLHASASLSYYFNNHLSVSCGLGILSLNSSYELKGDLRDTVLSLDINGDDFYKSFELEYDSAFSLSQLTLPVSISWSSSKPGHLGLFIESGLVFALNLVTRYESTGSLIYYGYYPFLPEQLQTLHLEPLGYYTEENINRNGRMDVKALNTFWHVSVGISIPLGYFSNLRIGPELLLGLNDIEINDSYTDLFGNEITRKSTLLKKYGLKMSYVLKL
jgi:hypothetical protein